MGEIAMTKRKFNAVKAKYKEGKSYHLMIEFVIVHIFPYERDEYFKLVATKECKPLFPGEYNIKVDHIRDMIVSYGNMTISDKITLAIPVEFIATTNDMHKFIIRGDIPRRKNHETILLESMARKCIKTEK